MYEANELAIIGMGPAGIGVAMGIDGTPLIEKTMCFEFGSNFEESVCNVLVNDACCESDSCHIISGIGGASSNSSGKISNFPAGSGLEHFFESEQELTKLMLEVISSLEKDINLRKIEIEQDAISSAKDYYKGKGITYKHYDVYEFDGQKYRNYLSEKIGKLINVGLQMEFNTEVIVIEYLSEKRLYKIIVKKQGAQKDYYFRNVVLSTGSMLINDNLIYNCFGNLKTTFEIGVRVEGETEIFKNTLNSHGDLKLKYKDGRTYCVTKNGRVISYRIDGMQFLEGCNDYDSKISYSNFAVVLKYDDENAISKFVNKYKLENDGIPVKQKYLDYINNRETTDDVFSTVPMANNGNIANLLPKEINYDLREFLNTVLKEAMHLDVDQLVLIAPEIKIIRNVDISEDFELQPGLFIVGAATGKFRGILQSFCSGFRCGKIILRK